MDLVAMQNQRVLKARFPIWAISRNILINSALIWMGLRLSTSVVGVTGTNALLACGYVVATVLLSYFDTRRRTRHLLLENLGISRVAVGSIASIPPVVFEALLFWRFN